MGVGVDVVDVDDVDVVEAEPLLRYIRRGVRDFGDWAVESAKAGRRTGELRDFFVGTRETLQVLLPMFRDFGLGLRNIFSGGEATGDSMLRSLRDPQAALAGRLGEAIRQLGETLQSEPQLRVAVNRFARRAVVAVSASYGDAIVTLVSDTVRRWDARTVTDRLEQAVGRDLQYIRVNGTLVGGLVGLAIHAAEALARQV